MRVLTFDLEDWFHVLDHAPTSAVARWTSLPSRLQRNTDYVLRELDVRGTRATFFCLGWVAEHYPTLVRQIAAAGHEIGTHSYAHRRVDQQSLQEFEADLVRSLRVLEDVLGKPVRCYRAPGFSLRPTNVRAFERLVAHGIQVDCSFFPFGRDREPAPLTRPGMLEFSGTHLREFPIGVGTCFGMQFVYSGAGYFRLLPYPLVRSQMRGAEYSMTYFHLRDFDPAQPTVEGLSRVRLARASVGLKSAGAKFRRMLDDFEFETVAAAVDRIDWSKAPVVKLGAERPSEAVVAGAAYLG